MATKVYSKPTGVADEKTAGKYQGLNSEQLIDAYRIMYTSRKLDDREILLKRQQRIFFQISGAGHEAVGVAASFALKAGYDWFYPYYRDRALCPGARARRLTRCYCRRLARPMIRSSGGRQMPSHWSFPS